LITIILGRPSLLGDAPGAVGAHFRARDGIHHNEGQVGGVCSANHLGDEVGIAGRVDQIDLPALPLHRDDGEVETELPFVFVFVVIADGVLVLDGPETGRAPTFVKGCFGEHRLTDAAVANQDHITDVFGGIHLHRSEPPQL
jgi:hypothetical protein